MLQMTMIFYTLYWWFFLHFWMLKLLKTRLLILFLLRHLWNFIYHRLWFFNLDTLLLQVCQWLLLSSQFNKTDLKLYCPSYSILFDKIVNLLSALDKFLKLWFVVILLWLFLLWLFIILSRVWLQFVIIVIIHSVYFGTDFIQCETLCSHFLQKYLSDLKVPQTYLTKT